MVQIPMITGTPTGMGRQFGAFPARPPDPALGPGHRDRPQAPHRRLLALGCLAALASSAMQAQVTGLSLHSLREAGESAFVTTLVEYPRVDGLPEVNERITAFVADSVADFRRESAENLRAWEETATDEEKARARPRHELLIRWKGHCLGPKALSLLFERYAWVGGANGRTTLFSINYDIQRRRFLDLGDLLGDKPATWPELVSTLARKELLARYSGQGFPPSMIEAGTAPDPANFSCFTFDGRSVTVRFQKYQVAPGSAGLLEFTLPLDRSTFLEDCWP